MKVAIVTQPLMANYGGILQNYALQQVLKQLGHEPVTIDWLPTAGCSVSDPNPSRPLYGAGSTSPRPSAATGNR